MADSATAFVPILTSRHRRHPVELPGDPTEEELARDWALSAEDRQEALRCRGEANRLSFALQLGEREFPGGQGQDRTHGRW